MAQDSELSLFLLQNQIQKAVQLGTCLLPFAKILSQYDFPIFSEYGYE